AWNFHTKFILKTISKNGIIRAMINEIDLNIENAYIEETKGIYGFLLKDDSVCRFEWLELASPI
ncbi:MAG: hypothetical protein PHP11_06465, partial [Erysipelotrichaceae bacterium]|nr:hypothetical protein [Erysipelotrichaceae bacterium]MDD3924724.1 hypothetical protein [Erysipelotrichaceae bacterium]